MKLAVVLFLASVLGLFIVSRVEGSSHGESPFSVKIPQIDITDFYMFRSYETGKSSNVVFIMNVQGLQNPNAGPNYFALSPDHAYIINIDNTGSGESAFRIVMTYATGFGGSVTSGNVPSVPDICKSGSGVPTGFGYTGISLATGSPAFPTLPIPLKAIGPVSAGDDSNLNWFEYYQL